MSFRSRSRSTQPLTTHRRSFSSSRVPSTSSTYNYNGGAYNGGPSNGYNGSMAARPLSTGYYQKNGPGTGSSSSLYYQSPYASIYGSRDNLYSTPMSRNGANSGYYSNGNGASHRHDYIASKVSSPSLSSAFLTNSSAAANKHKSHSKSTTYLRAQQASSSSATSYSNSYCGSSATSTTSSYVSLSSANGYESRYASNPFNSDRYVSPYSASYENGVTTASLSFNVGSTASGKSSGGLALSASNSFKGSNSYLNKSNSHPLHKGKSLSSSSNNQNVTTGSNAGVGVGAGASVGSANGGASAAAMAAIVSRSNSLREQERKSRNRTRSRSAAQRSLSASSDKSEGYESGSERQSRSRLGSTASSTTASASTSATDDRKTRDRSENGDSIDYKALWEAVKLENDKLKQQLKKKDEEIVQTRATLERFANATTKNSLSEIEKRERRAMERKLSELEEELKLLQKLKTENERLRAENRALTRVVSKLTTSAQSQLSKSK